MQRPVSIVWFERCYLACVAVGLANTAVSWSGMMEQLADSPQVAALGPAFGPGVAMGTIVLSVAISLTLWYFAARRGAAVAKWVLTVFFVISVLMSGFSAISGTYPQGLSGVLSLTALILNGIAVWQLFRPDTEAWFGETPIEGDVA